MTLGRGLASLIPPPNDGGDQAQNNPRPDDFSAGQPEKPVNASANQTDAPANAPAAITGAAIQPGFRRKNSGKFADRDASSRLRPARPTRFRSAQAAPER